MTDLPSQQQAAQVLQQSNGVPLSSVAGDLRLQLQQKHSDTEIDDQIQQMLDERYVQRTKELYLLIHEKFRNQPDKYEHFKECCRSFNSQEENNYEEPLTEIFTLLSEDLNLAEIFVSLLPKQFVQRLFPQVGQQLVERFDATVKQLTSPQTYDAYHQIVLDHENGKTDTEYFRFRLFELFAIYPQIIEELKRFFVTNDEQSNLKVASQDRAAASAAVVEPQAQVAASAPKKEKLKKEQAEVGAKEKLDSQEQAQAYDQTSQARKQVFTQPKGQPQNQSQPSASVQAQTYQTPRVIPELLQKSNFAKTDILFFIEQIPDLLQEGNQQNFIKLFQLYLDGILTQYDFLDIVKDLFEPGSEEILKYLENLISMRDKSRREGNQLLMPVSMVDIGQHKHSNSETRSYYKLPKDYYLPVCSGKYNSLISQDNLNDQYVCMDVRTDDYRAKIKNVHEDNLFKNEDEIYQMDFKILKFDNIINKLTAELDHATDWDKERRATSGSAVQKPSEYAPKFIRDQHFDFISKFYAENFTINPQQIKRRAIENSIKRQPIQVIKNFIQRFQDAANDLRLQKKDKIPDWQALCRANFSKSLDHRSFFFKNKQKDLLPIKKQLEELKKIVNAPIRAKSINQLKGGSSPNHPFYNTYSSFKLGEVCVYSDKDITSESFLKDTPINLTDKNLANKDPHALPHMRFLMQDKEMLKTTFLILISGPWVGGNITTAEKGKIEECLELLINKFFKLDLTFKQLKAQSRQTESYKSDEVKFITGDQVDYYQTLFKEHILDRDTNLKHEKDQAMEVDNQQPTEKDPRKILSQSKDDDDSSSEDSDSSQPEKVSSQASNSLQIKLQESPTREESGDQKSILQPAFKPGYSLLLGSSHFYFVFKMIATIYERLVMAKKLIAAKVTEDLAKEQIQELISKKESLEEFKHMVISSRFDFFIKIVIGTLSQTMLKKLDSAAYEDIVRSIMGGQAYLLFVFDKLITQTLRDLPKLKTQDECHQCLKLFERFTKVGSSQNEHQYMTQYQQAMQTVNNFSGISIRLLYSPLSGILCIHMFNLNPYGTAINPSGTSSSSVPNLGTQTILSYKPIEDYKNTVLQQNLFVKPNKEAPQEDEDKPASDPKLRWPVFLERNRRKMKQVRKHLFAIDKATKQSGDKSGQLSIENGLVMRQVPTIRKLQYDPNSGDYMVYQRPKTAENIEELWKQRAKRDYEKVLQFRAVVEQRQKNIDHPPSSEDGAPNRDEEGKMQDSLDELDNQRGSSSHENGDQKNGADQSPGEDQGGNKADTAGDEK